MIEDLGYMCPVGELLPGDMIRLWRKKLLIVSIIHHDMVDHQVIVLDGMKTERVYFSRGTSVRCWGQDKHV